MAYTLLKCMEILDSSISAVASILACYLQVSIGLRRVYAKTKILTASVARLKHFHYFMTLCN
jgi:hypothetical protein